MRIAIDYTAGIRQGAGVGTYVRQLVGEVLKQDQQSSYRLITTEKASKDHPFPVAPNVRSRNMLIPDRYLNILWYRFRVPVPAPSLFTGRVDLYHGPDFVLPPLPRRVKKVVTIHDLAFLDHPEYAVPSLAAYLKIVVANSIKHADVITTVSHEVNRTLIKHFQVPEERLLVVPNGVSEVFRPLTDPILLGATRNKFALKHPFVLCVGTLEPRKNHIGVIKAFHQLQGRPHAPEQLVIAGGKGWMYEQTQELVAELKLEEKVKFLGKVSGFELVALYNLADVFAFPSFAEGFGIPPLEAMACGTPVVTSDRSALPEVVGDAALQVNPHEPEAIAEAIYKILADPELQTTLREKGLARAKLFTWQQSAQTLLGLYKQLLHD